MRALKFGAVGVANTLLDVVLFSILTLLLHVPAVAANIVSYSAGIGSSFALNRTWTFRDRERRRTWIQLVLFFAGNLLGLALSTTVVAILVKVWGPILAKTASLAVTFAWNYLFSNLIVFRSSRPR
jgi:putative flippase GtrA